MKQFMCLLACMILMACGSDSGESEPEAAVDQTTQQVTLDDTIVELATRNVSCGCALEEVGSCGNYVEIESKYVEIANGEELGLGKMEWCKKEGVQAESAGEIKNGKFVAATLLVK